MIIKKIDEERENLFLSELTELCKKHKIGLSESYSMELEDHEIDDYSYRYDKNFELTWLKMEI